MIILAGTPLGNDGDASPRLRDALETADIIAAEDTRRLLNLVGRLGLEIHAPVIAYHDHNEIQKAPELIATAQAGKTIVMVSDAGMPSVSDPGYRLAALAAEEGVGLTVIPGPSAVLTALAISGLASDRFAFEGFPSRKSGERRQLFSKLKYDERTLIFFESPRRLAETLADMAAEFGPDRRAAVARELTKTFEEVQRGSLAALTGWAHDRDVKGEISIVVEGCSRPASEDDGVGQQAIDDVRELVELGVRLKDAAGYVAQRHGLRKNKVYQAVVALTAD
ncbi:16S rRNA (cytidine(1402)-2'-O)-methyltransferase [Arcanobacterium phocae]|uniref:16S rRNA (cytidine(1402)-2'-O)-methyltransferase n=1 Tax=Arcanobacterium phocae TaxID=131112 RepID=UPI001C0EF5DB|nr:16S rRNA (cytidine(1402)-2'-O)-methyltransferase [Arcanobacterium phocae]